MAITYLMASLAMAFAQTTQADPTHSSYDLKFDASKYVLKSATLNGATIAYRAYEGIVYVQHPVDLQYQTINIYVPEAYFQNLAQNGYTKSTAPIFFPNSIGGYMPGAASKPGSGMDRMNNTLLKAIAHGYVVAAPGARGRSLKDSNGKFTGKAPAAIVDLKAAVRYLKLNRGIIPGNVDRIVSNGTSAGGAMSSLLGATGNSPDYLPYLKALGAANTSDDVWATSAYCPITNLDHADMAYEWLLNGVNESKSFGAGRPPMAAGNRAMGTPPAGGNAFGQPNSSSGKMTATQIAQSAELKSLFPSYVNGLKLRGLNGKALTLDALGNGSFKEYLKSLLIDSATTALAKGRDLSSVSYVKVSDGKVVDFDWDGWVKTVGRMKQTAAFDNASLSTGENNEFGDDVIADKHFTAYGVAHNTAAGAQVAPAHIVKMMNPMDYIGAKGVKVSPFWRIRHGEIDRDTSLAISALLTLKLQNHGYQVDCAAPWQTPHSGDYDLDELFQWIDKNAKK